MKNRIIAPLLALALIGGCIENEESFYIEHVKTTPEFPDCEVSSGDPVAPYYYVDLLRADIVDAYFYVTNAVMIKNDYSNLVSESNGIIVDYYEVYTKIPSLGGAIGDRERFDYNHFIPPESSDILYAQLMSSASVNTLRDRLGCSDINIYDIANAIFTGDVSMLADLESGAIPETMLGVVRFIGHTQGGKDLETQDFSFSLNTSCGPIDGWGPCFASPCFGLCSDAAFSYSCSPGVNSPMSCAQYLSPYSGSFLVPDPTFTPGPGETAADAPMVDYCTANCGG